MFGLRTKRSRRDRRSGLVFQWRLPVSSHFGVFAAVAVVALIAAGLAAAVRVRVGNAPRQPERRGSLILVPQGAEWQALEMMALEAGPLPRRDDAANEPVVREMVADALAAALPPGYAYQPRLEPVEMESPPVVPAKPEASPGVLPPLPEPRPPSRVPAAPGPPRPLVLAGEGIRAIAPEIPPPAGLTRGSRYLLGYDEAGRVSRVTTLFAAEPAADPSAEQWLRRVKVEGGAKDGGWTAVEISSGS